MLMPHNLSRHALASDDLGKYKARALTNRMNLLLSEKAAAASINANVLRPMSEASMLNEACEQSDLILDMSASVPVARHIVHSFESNARRASLFLNPEGSALILLGEDKQRLSPLDTVEMQFYRATRMRPELHRQRDDGRVRVGQSCRDVSSIIPQSYMALHSGMGSLALREFQSRDESTVRVWKLNGMAYEQIVSDIAYQGVCREVDHWEVRTDEGLIDLLVCMRDEKAPHETGGVLLGSIDTQRNIIYIADALPSPPDSEERPRSYIRGVEGLKETVDEIEHNTNNMLTYIGEWHSHPPGSNATPSNWDIELLDWVLEHQSEQGYPGLIMVIGEHRHYEIRVK